MRREENTIQEVGEKGLRQTTPHRGKRGKGGCFPCEFPSLNSLEGGGRKDALLRLGRRAQSGKKREGKKPLYVSSSLAREGKKEGGEGRGRHLECWGERKGEENPLSAAIIRFFYNWGQ